MVAHETATSALLITRIGQIASRDRAAVFTVLVPETHVQHGLICDEVETRARALARAAAARKALRDAGLRVHRTEIGCASPLAAIGDELRQHPDEHDAIVLSTFAPGISRWLSIDLPTRVARDYDLPVLHVYPGGESAWAATAAQRQTIASGRRRQPTMHAAAAEGPVFNALWDLVPIAALLLLHAMLGVGLALLYSRTFFLTEALTISCMSLLVFGLWWSGRTGAMTPAPR